MTEHVWVVRAGPAVGRGVSYAVGRGGRRDDEALQPELADVGRLGRRLLDKAVRAARGEPDPLRDLLKDHLGPGADGIPLVTGSWQPYDHVNVQIGLDAWLARAGRRHELAGLTQFRHQDFGLAELVQSGGHGTGLGIGNVSTTALPAGPGGLTRSCVACGLYLV